MIVTQKLSIYGFYSKISSLIFIRVLVLSVSIVYLIVSFMDPGYVTSYVLRGDEFEEEDVEVSRNYYYHTH